MHNEVGTCTEIIPSYFIRIAPRPVVQTMQHPDKDSTLSRADDEIAHNEKERQESIDATRNLPEFLKPKAVDKATVDRKQGVEYSFYLWTAQEHGKLQITFFFYIPINRREISSYKNVHNTRVL